VAKDTTGAGDFFAGGFCAALINELDGQLSTLQPDSIEKSIKIGQEIAAKCVSFLGTNLSEAEWETLSCSMRLKKLNSNSEKERKERIINKE